LVLLMPRPFYTGGKRTLYEAFAAPLPQAELCQPTGSTPSSYKQSDPAPAEVLTWDHTDATDQESMPLSCSLAIYQDAANRSRRW
jgi:hypothetical protein